MYANFKMGDLTLSPIPLLTDSLMNMITFSGSIIWELTKESGFLLFFIFRNKTFVGQIKLFAGRGDTLESVVSFVQCKKRKTFQLWTKKLSKKLFWTKRKDRQNGTKTSKKLFSYSHLLANAGSISNICLKY